MHNTPKTPFTHPPVDEANLTLVSEGTRLEGQITFDSISKVHGVLIGKVHAKKGSTLILSETAVIEGEVKADTLFIDGYVQGKITARTRVLISRTGRVVGDVKTPSLIVEHGAFFEGRCLMEDLDKTKVEHQPQPAAVPVD